MHCKKKNSAFLKQDNNSRPTSSQCLFNLLGKKKRPRLWEPSTSNQDPSMVPWYIRAAEGLRFDQQQMETSHPEFSDRATTVTLSLSFYYLNIAPLSRGAPAMGKRWCPPVPQSPLPSDLCSLSTYPAGNFKSRPHKRGLCVPRGRSLGLPSSPALSFQLDRASTDGLYFIKSDLLQSHADLFMCI